MMALLFLLTLNLELELGYGGFLCFAAIAELTFGHLTALCSYKSLHGNPLPTECSKVFNEGISM